MKLTREHIEKLAQNAPKEDNTPMPDMIKLAVDNDMKDYNNVPLIGVEVVNGKFERGHEIPKSKGGSNLKLKPQLKKSNRQYGANAL